MKGHPEGSPGGPDFAAQTPPDDDAERTTLQDRMVRYSDLKRKQTDVAAQLGQLGPKEAADLAARLAVCGTHLTFRDYYTVGQVKLTRACFCKKHTVCQLCAVRRSARFIEKTLPRLEHLMTESPVPLYAHLVTFTVKNGPDLAERVRHLESSWQRLRSRAKNRRDYPETFLRSAVAGILSMEVTNRGNGWHPHLHVLVLSTEKTYTWEAVKDEWKAITGDSRVVNFSEDSYQLAGTLAETCKYLTKFSDLTVDQLWEVHRVFAGRKSIRGFGKLHGLRVPDKLTDDVLAADLPYIEYVCRYLGRDGYTILTALRGQAAASEPEASVHQTTPAEFRRLQTSLRCRRQ